MKKYLIVVMAAALTLVGCKEEENPALAPEDIETYATLTGYIVYERPTSVNSSTGSVKVDELPLANQVVEVTVSGAQYSDATSASKVTYTYTGTIDAQGMFSINVPVVKNSKGVNISNIALRPFRLQSFPWPTYSYTDYDWSLVNETIYYNGKLLSIMSPGTLYPDKSYFCGNEHISYSAFQVVGK